MSALKVTLLAHSPEPEKVVACGAKLCYSSAGIDDLFDNLTPEKTAGFIDMLNEIGHESPMEHAVFTFGIEGVSRSLLAQITRHRIASYSVKSQRYVNEGHFEYIIPPEIENNPEAKKIFIEAMEFDQKQYNSLVELLKPAHVKRLICEGKDEKTAERMAEKAAIEDARFILPNACETKMIVTMNARALLNFFHERCCNRAQWEIHNLADEMLKLVIKAAPNLFKNAGPSCVKGSCPEGKMSCGKIKQVKEYYKNFRD